MGSNNNQNQQQQKPTPPPGAIPTSGGMPATFTGNTPGSQQLPTNLPTDGSPRNSSQNFTQNAYNNYQNQQNPLMNQAAYGYGQATQNDAADRSSIMDTYKSRYGLTPSGGGSGGNGATSGGGGALNTRLPGETSAQWVSRVANATGRSDIANDPGSIAYWESSINSKPQNADMGYWLDKFNTPDRGGGGGGFGGGGYAGTQYAGLAQAGPAAQAGYTSAGGAATAGTQYSAAPRSLDMTKLGQVKPSDPFNSYAGYTEFSNTGGYSPTDIANMRARGIAPIRAAYANAERNVGQQRSLQGGYSPNAIAAQVKMAREQGQGMADASQNVEAGIAQARNQGRLAGLGGMQGIEGQRLNAQMQGDIFNATQGLQGQEFDIGNELQNSQFNAGQGNQVGMYNAGQTNQMGQFNAGQANQVGMFNTGQTNQRDEFNTGQSNQVGMFNAGQGNQVGMYNAGLGMQGMQGMTSLLGTTPAMTDMFGRQALGLLNSNGSMAGSAMNAWGNANGQPDQFTQDLSRINATGNTAANIAAGVGTGINAYQQYQNRNQPPGQPGGYPGIQGGTPPTLSELYPNAGNTGIGGIGGYNGFLPNYYPSSQLGTPPPAPYDSYQPQPIVDEWRYPNQGQAAPWSYSGGQQYIY